MTSPRLFCKNVTKHDPARKKTAKNNAKTGSRESILERIKPTKRFETRRIAELEREIKTEEKNWDIEHKIA